MLARALSRERGVTPEIEVHRWHEELSDVPSVYSAEQQYIPTVERPLIYHFFGAATYQDSIVLTQDNFVDALVSASRESSTVPKAVSAAFTRTTLLFLGFRLDTGPSVCCFATSSTSRELNFSGTRPTSRCK